MEIVSYQFKIKSALLTKVMYSPMFGWLTKEEIEELR